MRRARSLVFVALLLATLAACGGASGPGGRVAPAGQTATPVPSAAPTSAPPAPSAAPVPTATPTSTGLPAAPPAAPRSAAPGGVPSAAPTSPSGTTPRPNGPVPAGWKVYTGPRAFPIVIAYPPDWTVDTSLYPAQLIVFLVGPHDGQDEEQRVDIEPAAQPTGANIDVQRDDYYYRKTEFCDGKGIESTAQRQVSGATFATLGATCDQSNTLYFLQVASGVTGGDEWNISLRSTYDRKEEHRAIFDQMLASINIYALIPR
jgi:hypothetical protein